MNAKLFLVIFVIGLAIAQIFVSAGLAGRGQDLAALERQAAELTRQNQELRNQISSFGSLSKVASQAAQLGFGKPQELLYLVPEEPVAQKVNP